MIPETKIIISPKCIGCHDEHCADCFQNCSYIVFDGLNRDNHDKADVTGYDENNKIMANCTVILKHIEQLSWRSRYDG